MNPESFNFSLIIPTYNRGKITYETIKCLENQQSNRFELIIIDQSDLPFEPLSSYKSHHFVYRYYHIKEVGLPNARNVGAKKARGEFLLFIDDDAIPHSKLIASYMDEFQFWGDSVWVIAGRIFEKNTTLFREQDDLFGGKITWYGKTLKNFDTDLAGECEWAAGGNFAVRKEKYFEVGGFDTGYIGNAILEDGDFCTQIRQRGGKVIYSPKPKIEHLRAVSGGTRQTNPAKGMYYRSYNTVYYFRKHGKRRYIVPVFFYLNAVALKEWLRKKHGLIAFYYTSVGFIRGLFTKVNI